MTITTLHGLIAMMSLLPAAALSIRPRERPDGLFWAAVAVAVAGPVVWTLLQIAHSWNTGLPLALWITVAASALLFAALAAVAREAWRLAVLLFPYLLVLATLAVIWQEDVGRGLPAEVPPAWIEGHIVVAVGAYALLTLGAIAALAVFLKERALKRKRRGGLARALPSVAEGETLQVRLFTGSLALLALGILSGMATQYYETGAVLELDHKTVLSLLAFVLILGLLVAHHRTGVRGRRVARFVLLAYLLLTLAYPGVKFVTDVLLA